MGSTHIVIHALINALAEGSIILVPSLHFTCSFIIARVRLNTITPVTTCGMNVVRSDGRVIIKSRRIPNGIAKEAEGQNVSSPS